MNLQQELHRLNKLLGEKEELMASLQGKLSSQEEQNRKQQIQIENLIPAERRAVNRKHHPL